LDDHFGCPLLKMTIIWINYFFGWSLAIKIYSCIKDFILIALDNLILAQRIYHWTLLLLHEEFIVEWFCSCMKSLSLNDLILIWRIYHFGWFNSCTKNLPLDDFTLSWLICGFILRDFRLA